MLINAQNVVTHLWRNDMSAVEKFKIFMNSLSEEEQVKVFKYTSKLLEDEGIIYLQKSISFGSAPMSRVTESISFGMAPTNQIKVCNSCGRPI